jgi:thymidylate synthase ThyX
MKVTHVAICPSEASSKAGRPALTPELLAASAARYSRNNEGLDSILAKIDPADLERSVDSIFKMVDYGHQSIADMVPVAMFIDGISIWLAYYLWTLCPTAGGQESSTRYLRLSAEGLVPASALGIKQPDLPDWETGMANAFQAYQSVLGVWEELAHENPSLMGIPASLQNDTSAAAQKKVARMKRNFAFDRARYFLPVAAATNVMLIMSARGWVNLCQHLLSHLLPEPRTLGERLRQELQLSAPRMLKHARCTESNQQYVATDFEKLVQMANLPAPQLASSTPYLSVLVPADVTPDEVTRDLGFHSNRYAPVGTGVQRIGVRFGWRAMAFAEIRDLNRHRTGSKYCPLVPQGFYFALEQLPDSSRDLEQHKAALLGAARVGTAAGAKATALLRNREPAYIYWALLGTQFPFEHITTADKFIYEAELRTGLGAHYRYAKHLREVLALWYEKFPQTRPLILEGAAEPE